MLNSEQKKAVEHTYGPLLMIAGAGAGKTHTLTERVANMVSEKGINPGSILCVTFTNKAAKEMRERICHKLGKDVPNINPFKAQWLPLIGTFHSVGIFFLRLFGEQMGYGKNFIIFDEDDKMALFKAILKEKNLDEKQTPPRQIAGVISQAKNQWITADQYGRSVDNYFKSIVNDVYKIYDERMRRLNALDFDDILLKTLELLKNPEVLEYFHNRFEYIFVDEYQDTNDIQYEIVRLLALKTKNLCVVGDDWQGIYSWRGANIKNILNFKRDYPDATVIKLEQNYRSTKTIIAWANKVIKNNAEALDKTLWTDNEEGEKIMMIEAVSEKHEAESIAKIIKESDYDYSKWAILYRTNSQSRLVEEALIKSGIPYKIYGGVKFYERKEIKDILAYMRLIFNPFDTISLKRIINVPSRKIGDKSTEILLNYISNYSLPFNEIIANVEEIDELGSAAKKSIALFGELYNELAEYSLNHSVKETMEQVISRIRYQDYLESEYTSEEYQSKIENIWEFANMASRYDGLESREALSLFLEEIALITDSDRDEAGQNLVSLMTIHLSKGLEFENVVIAWAEEWLFPHSRTLLEPKEIEEERRLMYVAMTRAKKRLYISRARERYTFGNYSANPASRFLKEIPEELKDIYPLPVSYQFGGFGSSGAWDYLSKTFESSFTPSEPKKRTIVHNDPNTFTLGQKVKHVQFGVWTIISLKGPIAEIAFWSGYGIKKMNIEIAPIEKA